MQNRKKPYSVESIQNSYWLPLDSWPRLFPWILLFVGVLIGPLFAYSPWLFAVVALASIVVGWLVER